MGTADFIVVGAGIAGASVAYHLAAQGRVVVIERESQPGYHTTGRSAAIFSESYGNPVIGRLTAASRRFTLAPPDGFAAHPILTPRGSLTIADAAKASRLEATWPALHAAAPRLQRLDEAAVAALVPCLKPGIGALGVLDPDAMDIDVNALHQGFLRGVASRGGRLLLDAEVGAIRRVGTAWRVVTGDDAWDAAVVVNAAGAWADDVAIRAGVRPIGLVPKRRTVVTIDGPLALDVARLPCVVELDRDWYVKPEAGRLLASPADETPSPPCDAQPEEIDVARTMARLEAALAFPLGRPRARWAGLRSFVADRCPVIGMAPDAPGFFWLAGQGGHGIQTADAAARLATALITGAALPADIATTGLTAAALAPDRPALAAQPASATAAMPS